MATGNIIGKVNVPISPIKYTGEETLTAITNVDNDRKVISVDVKVEEVVKDCATKEELQAEVTRATEAEEALDNKKLDKSNTSNTLYGKDAQGNEANIYYSSDFNDKAWQAVIRDEHSDVLVPTTPSSNNGATSKGYVDAVDAAKVSKAGDVMTGALGFKDTNHTYSIQASGTDGLLIKRDGTNRISIFKDSVAVNGDLRINEMGSDAKSATTKSYVDGFGKSLAMSLDSSYNLTINLKDANNNVISTQTIDLPLESIVTSATYYETYTYEGVTYTKVIVITLETTDVPTIIPVGDLVRGLENVANKVISISDQSTDEEYPSAKCVYDSLEGVSDSLKTVIQAETSRAEQAEGMLSDEIDETKTHYFAGIVSGEHVDSQVGHTKSWCYDGSMVVGGETPSTAIIRFTQTSNKALYIKSISINYTKNGEDLVYLYFFDRKVFTENNQTQDLDGISWLLSDTHNVSYFGYNGNYGQQIGSGSLGIRDCSLTTTDFAGCTITKVVVQACGAASTNCKLSIEVAGDTWLYHEGLEDESTQYQLQANPATIDDAEFTHGEGSTPGSGTIVTFHNVFLEKNDNEEVVSSEASTETLYVNKDNYLFYMWDGSDFFIISKTLTLGQTSTTAYRGDWGSQNQFRLE